jgi:ubiquinone/menaquinone biosynthesis C-methylase UbiE
MRQIIMSNDTIIEAWNTVLFEKFTRFREIFVTGYSKHSEELFKLNPFDTGDNVLDVGCGWGDTTLRIAEQVGPKGSAIGVDCAANYISVCNNDAIASGLSNAQFFVADVERENLQGPYDAAFSRCGTMFFNFPGLAMRNIYKSLKPGGRFTQIVWRKREDNGWLFDAEQCARKIVPVISHEDTDAVHCGPGPFSMAGPDMVSDMMQVSGFEKVSFHRHDTDMRIGHTLDDAVEFAMEIGPAGEIIRLAEEEGQRLSPQVRDSLYELFSQRVRDDGSVWATSSAWFLNAYRV